MLLLIISMTFFTSLHADLLNASAANLGAVPAGGENEENEAAVIEQYFQYRFDQMKDKSGKIPDGVLIKALNERKAMAAKQENRSPFAAPVAGIDNTSWIEAGPQNVGGRIRAILPLSPSTILIGGVSGGLWKTTNCCSTSTTWTPIDDWMANLGVSSLIMDPTNANVMYAGTGETSGTSFRGAGVFKSTDGGNTWIQLASTNNNQWYFVNRLAISPNGANLMAATGTGLYRSTDGGATWSQRVSSNWRDVKFDPTNSNNAVAGGSGFSWYTTNGGLNWTTATFNPAITGRVELAYSPSNPSIVYASINQNSGDVYKSIDGGHTYTRVNTGQQLLSSQGDYDNTIWVKPDDPNFVVVAGVDMYKSIDGGTTFTKIAYWGYSWHYRNPPSPHADHHALVSIPGSNLAMLNGNDGGIYYTADVTTAGTNADYNLGWVYMNNNLGITQFYGIAGNNNGVIIGGAQDNGATLYSPANGTNGWTYFSGGDGGKAAADPTNPNYLYNEYIYGKIYRSSDGGATVDKIDGTYWNGSAWVCRAAPYRIDDACNGVGSFIAPILLDPNNPNRLFVGDLSLWVSNDVRTPYDPYSPTGGPQWTALKPSMGSGINAIAVAPSDSNVIWVGYNNSRIDMTTDGGATWTRVDTNFGASYPGTRAGSIAIDKNDSNTVYVGFWGYGSNRIWRTQDGGATWTSITNNLPQTPVYAVAINPLNSAWLYVGTEIGIFASVDGGATWNVPAGTGKNGDGPANVATFDLQWMGGGNSWGSPILIAGTHGRGAWTADLTPPTVTSTYADDDSLCDGNIPCYPTIAEAMNNVSTGGTVMVYAGAYAENITINRNVTLNVLGDMTTSDVSLYSGSTWNANSWTMTAGNVNVYGGTWNANNSTLTINDFNLASGTWNAGSSTITVNGNWAPSGTFNVGTGTVVFAKNGLVTVNNPAVTEGTVSFCNLTISANTTVDVTDDFISAATGGGCTQYIQNGKLRREAPTQYIINYNLWTFKDARNRDAVLLTKTTGTSLHNTNVTITSNLQPPTTCGSNPLPAQPVLRQYNIVGTDMGGTYTTRFYFTTSNPDESNGNTVSNLAIYHCNSSTSQWEKFTGTSGNDANGAYIQANVNSFVGSTFVIGSNNPINQAPVAVNDSYSTNENTALTIAAPGVLNNDTDADGNSLTAVKVTDPAHGTLTLNANGSFSYVPAANYSGADSFTYKANDGTIDSNTATVNITVVPNEYTLTVNSAHGTVTKSPDKLTYHYGDVVALSVTADAGWTFTSWTPALADNKVTISGNTTVTANFTQNEYTLTVNSAHGTVTRDNNGPYHLNDVVTLTAVADAGWTFTGWTPALTDNKVTIAGNTTVTANFVQNEYTLTVNSAHGTVTKTPDKLTYHYGDEVVLGVTADAGWTFTNWTPALTGNKVTITSNMTVAANFTQDEYTLVVNSAHGSVTKSPDKLTYHYGEEVTLSVIADAGWTFAGWAPPLTDNKVTITGNTTVTANFTQNEYTLTVLKVGNGTVTRDNNGPYHLNDVVTLTAVADEGWTFTGWTPSLTDNKVTITGDTTVTANFTQNEYTLTVLKVGNGTVTRDNNGPYHLNDVVTLTAVADAGWTFTGWTPVLTENKVTITGDTTVTATFTQNEYTLTVLKVGNGTVTRDNNGPYHLNDVVTLTAVGDTGWTFTGWTPSLTDNKVTITGDTTVTATFTQNEYNLTIVSLHGTVTKSPDKPTYRYGEEVTLSVTSENGWTFTGWTPALTANKFIITGDTTVTANFTQNEYILTVNSAHGAVTKTPDKLTYHYGEEVTLSVVADAGWMFTGWAPTLTANKVTITGDTTVTANFTQNEYTLTVNSAHGTVTKTPDKLTYHYGEEVALGVTADAGWTFTGWTPALTDSKVIITGDTTVTANFTQNEYTLTVNSAHGTVTRDNNGPYHLNDVVTLTVASDAGWTFTGWTPSLSANKVTITGDTTVTANFTQNEYTLTVNSAHGTVTKTPDQLTYHYGEEVTLSVTADLGWTFTGWTPSLTANKVTITGDTTVTANFTQNEYTLTVNSAHGTVTKSPDKLRYNYGEEVTLSMTADAGWTFTGWTPILIDNKVTITGDTTIAANFMQNEYDLTVVSAHGTVTRDNNGPYHLNDVVTLTVVADAGWTFTDWTPALTNNTVTITGDTTVTANYSQNAYTLSIVSAHGTVAKSPDKAAYAYGEVVQLTVIPDAGWSFANWTGDATGSANPVSVTMDGNKSVTANYAQNGYTLTVVSAHGMVTKSPDQATYHFGEEVTLSVTADTGWTFTGWTPDLTNNKVTITDDTTVTANFTQDEYTLSIVSAHGTVTKSPDKATYHYGEEVTLSVTADAGWTFTGWTPALTDNKITITGDTTITANFTQNEYTLTVISAHSTVTRDNNGPYHLNDVVTLSVVADAGWTFTGWTPALTDNKVIITGNTTVTANFVVANTAPVATNDSYTTDEDTALTVAAPGVLGNDTDVDGNALTAILVNGPLHGTLTLDANGSFAYTPAAGYHGADSFTYKANDGQTDSNTATVSITVIHVNHAPVAVDDTASTTEATVVTVNALSNDSDPDGDSLAVTTVGAAAHGSVVIEPDFILTYTPAALFNGTDEFTYTISDGNGGTATAKVTVTVGAVNDAPIAGNDLYATDEDTPLTIPAPGVLANDNDPDGDALSAVLVDNAAHGTLALHSDGSLTYTPAANFNGSDSFTYKANDGTVDSNTATVNITVNAVNDAPVTIPQSISVDEDGSVSIILTGSDVDGDALTFSVTADPVHGTLSGTAPDLTYTPNADYNGADNFTFKVSDGFLEAQAQITITVNPINDAPVAVLDAYETDENAPLDVPAPGVLANDTDVDGDALTAVLVGSVSHGTLVFNADGSFLYTPEANFNGEDSFTYKANDGVADSNGVTGTIKIHVVNYPPSASNDTYNTDEDTTLTIAAPGLLGNDSDADGDMLSAVKATDPSHGTLTLNADGSFTYTPAANWHGIDTFTYKATDGIQESNSAEVTIVVKGINDAPLATPQSVSLDEDTQKAITLSGSDVDGDTLTYTIVTMPANGVLSGTAPNVSYKPNANFFGDDLFTFTVNDGNLTSELATVNIHVNSVNDVPVCLSLSLTTDEDTASTRSPSCTDVDNTVLSYQIVAPAGHGTASISGGLLAYGPNANYNGADAFTYKANDGVSDSNTANVAVTVNPINDAPMANNQSVTTDQNTPKAITLTGSDVEGSPLTFAIVTGPTHGSLSGTSPSVTYTPAAGYSGSDSFTFKVDDGALDSNIATVSITVVAVNHAPVAMNDAYSTNANTTLTVAIPGVLSNDTDPDGNALSAVNVTNPAHGTLTLNTNGSFTYTPATGYVGSDSFTYKASDSALNSNAATVTITVDAVQHPALTLTKSASPTIYSYPNQTITYAYVVKNAGDVVLTGPFLISDDKLGSFKCGIVTSLAVNASVTCSKNYTIVASDLNLTNNATITNHATVSGKFGTTVVTSNQVQVTIRQAASTAKITSSNATCSQFKAGASVDLLEEFYTVKLGKVNSISPGVFQYYTAVTAPASTFQVTVQQTDPTNWPAIGVQNLNVYVYNANCSGVSFSAVIYSNKVTFTIRNAKAGATYYLAVKYQPNSLIGQKVNTPYPTVPYLFTTSVNNTEVITSWDSLNIKPR
jgi:VCBS repeat-containing protein